MIQKKVSVIVPVYNVEKYLRKCLNSLVNQTMKNIEIIIVNDGSPDNSEEIIREYKKKYPEKIKVLNQVNQGLSGARNNGLQLATAKYIMFVDSDDYLCEDAVEKVYNKIITEEADFLVFGNNVVDESDNILSTTFPCENKYESTVEKIIFGNMCAWNKIYKKSFIENNKINFRVNVWYEDLDYSFKTFVKANKIAFLEENLYNYLIRENSIMSNQKADKNLEIIDALDEIIAYAKNNHVLKKHYDMIEFLCIYHIYICAVTRVINMNIKYKHKKKLIDKFIKYTKKNFPKYKNNKYLTKLSFSKKMVFNLIWFKQFWLIKVLFKIKNNVD